MKRHLVLVVVLVAASLVGAQQPTGQSAPVEWLYYGGDQGGTKYSSLTDIGPENVQRLQIAWQWKHWDTPPAPGFFESTPHLSRAKPTLLCQFLDTVASFMSAVPRNPLLRRLRQ